MKCYDHPRYGAVRQPAVPCPRCWAMYLLQHPDALMYPGAKLALVMDE